MKLIEGSIVAPRQFRAAGISCGLKPEGRDLALIASDRPCLAAGCFTTIGDSILTLCSLNITPALPSSAVSLYWPPSSTNH